MIKERLPNYTQVCVFPGLLVDENKIQEFIQYLNQNNQQDSLSDYFTK